MSLFHQQKLDPYDTCEWVNDQGGRVAVEPVVGRQLHPLIRDHVVRRGIDGIRLEEDEVCLQEVLDVALGPGVAVQLVRGELLHSSSRSERVLK